MKSPGDLKKIAKIAEAERKKQNWAGKADEKKKEKRARLRSCRRERTGEDLIFGEDDAEGISERGKRTTERQKQE